VHLLFLDESGQLAEKKFFALGGIALRDSDWPFLREFWQSTAAAEWGGGQARGYLKTLLPRFACHPATGELDRVGIKRFPEQVRRPREETRLFEPPAV
jgi:hypothetical protein